MMIAYPLHTQHTRTFNVPMAQNFILESIFNEIGALGTDSKCQYKRSIPEGYPIE
jgi:hypothetical protein